MRRALGLVAMLAAGTSGCGDDEGRGADRPRLVVSAAASLTEALGECGPRFPGAAVRFSFAGSDELAAQIRQGVEPDVYAAADTRLPAELHDEGRLGRPVEFATNELVVAVPEDSPIRAVEDLAASGIRLAIGSESVPIGFHTRERLTRLPSEQGRAILANVRSNEPDVKGIVGKLTQGAVDAGFVYRTDVNAADGELRAVRLPERLEPEVTYAAGVVEGAREPERARAFVDGLLDGGCARALRAAGFGAAP